MASHPHLHLSQAAQCLAHWCTVAQPSEALLYLSNGAAQLCLTHRGSDIEHRLPAGWQGLLCARSGLCLLEGTARVWPVAPSGLVKLQYFIDQGSCSTLGEQRGEPLGLLAAPLACLYNRTVLEQWYLDQAVQAQAAYRAFAAALRYRESYRLVSFLSQQATEEGTLGSMAQRYGVSVAHFRRLCHIALGAGGKSQLRDWRTATALLAVADGPASLTEVALNCGYASSSHFARDIRQMLGVVPSSLIDITRLAAR